MSCNDPDRSNTFPCYYRGASIFRTGLDSHHLLLKKISIFLIFSQQKVLNETEYKPVIERQVKWTVQISSPMVS